MLNTDSCRWVRGKMRVGLAVALVGFVGCSDTKKPAVGDTSPTEANEAADKTPSNDAQVAASQPGTETDTQPIASAPEVATAATDEDVEFVRPLCEESGFNEEQCACSMKHAKEMLSAEQLKKLKDSPDEDDPALVSYYSAREMAATMAWVEKVDVACKLAELEPIEVTEPSTDGVIQ